MAVKSDEQICSFGEAGGYWRLEAAWRDGVLTGRGGAGRGGAALLGSGSLSLSVSLIGGHFRASLDQQVSVFLFPLVSDSDSDGQGLNHSDDGNQKSPSPFCTL